MFWRSPQVRGFFDNQFSRPGPLRTLRKQQGIAWVCAVFSLPTFLVLVGNHPDVQTSAGVVHSALQAHRVSSAVRSGHHLRHLSWKDTSEICMIAVPEPASKLVHTFNRLSGLRIKWAGPKSGLEATVPVRSLCWLQQSSKAALLLQGLGQLVPDICPWLLACRLGDNYCKQQSYVEHGMASSVKTSVLGPNRFRNRQAPSGDVTTAYSRRREGTPGTGSRDCSAAGTAPLKKAKEAALRRNCLVDWMEMSVHVAPGQRQSRQRAVPQGLQEQYTSIVRHYLTDVALKQGTKNRSHFQEAGPGSDEHPLLVQVKQVFSSTEGVLLLVHVVKGCSPRGIAEGSLMRMLLHQRHSGLQACLPQIGSWIQVVKFNVLQVGTSRGAFLLPVELASAPEIPGKEVDQMSAC
eukprot:s487_g8.t1